MTTTILITVTIVLVLYDIWTARDNIDGNTITQVLQRYSRQYPVIPFAFGFLAGHLFGDF